MAILSSGGVAISATPPSAVGAVQAAAGLAVPDAGTIRFTVVQPGGQGATVYEAARGGKGVTRTLIDLIPGPAGGWAVAGRETKPLAAETFDYFRDRIDTALRREQTPAPCANGPDYYAEHGANGAVGCGTDGDLPAIARGLGLADPVSP